MTPRNQIIVDDANRALTRLAPKSVDCIVTSPPYFALRNYGVDGQLGQEPSVQDWVDELRLVVRGLARVLKPTGSIWLNLGDSYSRNTRYGAISKSLLLGPERLVLALQSDGWIVRNKIVWAKTNPQPSSVGDRLTSTWEVIYFLVRQREYVFDLDAIRVPHRSKRSAPRPDRRDRPSALPLWAGPLAGNNSGLSRLKSRGMPGHPLGKNPGDVWSLATAGFREAHFAVFPEALVEPPILAGCPERICVACEAPWRITSPGSVERTLESTCICRADWRPGVVLDPFFGSGTVGVVAERLRRDWLGIELNPAFARLARRRIESARSDKSEVTPESKPPVEGERHAA
jgi:site-specific DNA-methyltransferase (adenine-specific)